MTTLQDLARAAHANSKAHGFWPTTAEENSALNRLYSAAVGNRQDDDHAITDDVSLLRKFLQEKGGRNFGELMALIHSEVSEGLEENRSDRPDLYYAWDMEAIARYLLTNHDDLSVLHTAAMKAKSNHEDQVAGRNAVPVGFTEQELRALIAVNFVKPEGAAIELIDTMIRCLDTLDTLEFGENTVDDLMEMKMLYNAGRQHKHGRKY